VTTNANESDGASVIVLVCGDREFNDRKHVFETLNRLQRDIGPFAKLVHGAARGANPFLRAATARYRG
jgi:hypothetical protein